MLLPRVWFALIGVVLLLSCGPTGKNTRSRKTVPARSGPEDLGTGGGGVQPARAGSAAPRPAAAESGGRTAPRTEVDCDALQGKNRQCMETFVETASRVARAQMQKHASTMSPEQRKQFNARIAIILKNMAAQMRSSLAGPRFMKMCQRNWTKDTPAARKEKAKITACFMKPQCADYVRCLLGKRYR